MADKESVKGENPVVTMENKTHKKAGLSFKNPNFTIKIGNTVYSNENLTKKTLATLKHFIPDIETYLS